MVVSVQGTSTQDINTINQQKIQDFKDGKTNITKKDLTGMLSSEIAQGQDLSSDVIDLLDSYDQIDKDGDGISYEEFKTYNNTATGILNSLGLSSSSINNSINTTLLNSLKKQPSLLDSDLFGTNSNKSATLTSSNSYLDNLMQSYNTSSTNAQSTLSLADYLI